MRQHPQKSASEAEFQMVFRDVVKEFCAVTRLKQIDISRAAGVSYGMLRRAICAKVPETYSADVFNKIARGLERLAGKAVTA